jgi:hypothetical protein
MESLLQIQTAQCKNKKEQQTGCMQANSLASLI